MDETPEKAAFGLTPTSVNPLLSDAEVIVASVPQQPESMTLVAPFLLSAQEATSRSELKPWLTGAATRAGSLTSPLGPR